MTKAPILIYIPTAKALTAELAQAHNLGGLFSARSFREVQIGPEGQGLVIAPNDTDPDLITYNADRQRWSKRFGCSSYVGHWNDRPQPTAGDLAKPNQLPGVPVQLLDGKPWTVPVLRAWHDGDVPTMSIRLPRIIQQNPETGNLVLGPVVPTYQQIWDRSLQVFSLMCGQQGAIDNQSANMFALELLQINYWVDTSVLSHLGLLTEDICGDVIKAALDMKTFEGYLKNQLSRSESSGTTSDSGN